MAGKERQDEREKLLLRARALAERQGVKPITSINDLRGDFWPAEESADDFLQWLRAVRQEDVPRSLPE